MFRITLLFILFICIENLAAQTFFRTENMDVLKKDLILIQGANVDGTVLRLTNSAANQVGACWFKKKQLDLDKGFETEFTFKIHGNDPIKKGGDGFAFVLQGQGIDVIGGKGDDIGYKGIKNAVVIEFDTYEDESDNSRNQIALMRYDAKQNKYVREATVHEIRELNNGKEHFARIEYKDGMLTFYLDSYLFPVLSYKVDLPERIGKNKAWIGFTAATSDAYSYHDILSWNLSEFLPAPEDIKEEVVKVLEGQVIEVKSRNVIISVWDHNKVDGDIISLKINDKYIVTKYTLEAIRKKLNYRLTGFQAQIILYAHNLGEIPPNTAAIEVDDGITKQTIKLKASLQESESLILQYSGEDL
jgi:hypothetical protein